MKAFTLLILLGTPVLAVGPIVEMDPVRVVDPGTGHDEHRRGEAIALAKPIDVSEILSRQSPAFTYVRKGPVAGDFLLRGLGKDDIDVTLDGGRIQGACPNRMDPPAFHVSSQQIRSITVRTGPFDVEYGSSVGGTVRVETGLDPDAPLLQATGFLGEYEYYGAGLQVSSAHEPLALGGGVFYQEGGVYKDGGGNRFTDAPQGNNAYRPGVSGGKAFAIWNAQTQVEVPQGERGLWEVSAGYNDARDVLYPGLMMDAIKDVSWRGNVRYRHRTELDWAEEWSVRVSGSLVDHDMQDRFRQSSQMNPAFAQRGYMMRTEAETKVGEIALTAEGGVGYWDFRYGVDYREYRWNADNIIMLQENDFIPDTLSRRGGLWGVGLRDMGFWDLEIGARFDVGRTQARRNIDFLQDAQDTSTNRVDDLLPAGYVLLGRLLDPAHRIEFGVGHGNRLPTGEERYRQLNHPNPAMPNRVGDPDLRPVRSTEVRSSLAGSKEMVSYRGGVFHTWLTDYIYPVGRTDGGSDFNTFDNVGARLWGADLTGRVEWSDLLSTEAGMAWQRGRKSTLAPGMNDRVLGEIPPWQGRLAMVFTQDSYRLMAEGLFSDSQSRIDEEIGEQRVSGWGVMNLQADWQLAENLLLSGGIDNVFDREYATNNAFVRDPFSAGVVVNEPGRFAYMRIQARF